MVDLFISVDIPLYGPHQVLETQRPSDPSHYYLHGLSSNADQVSQIQYKSSASGCLSTISAGDLTRQDHPRCDFPLYTYQPISI